MGSWGTGIFSNDIALDIRREYGTLLSIGIKDDEVERMLIDYYKSVLNCDNPDEGIFWISLAYCEWKKGRLSDLVKEKALAVVERERDLQLWENGDEKEYLKRKNILNDFYEMIISPMPIRKSIKKITTHHCPWREGSLLAYKIVSNEALRDDPCFHKYVLIRVLQIEKYPISQLFDTGYYDEGMIVGLYNWIGDELPDMDSITNLQYIPFTTFALFNKKTLDETTFDNLCEEERLAVINELDEASKKQLYWCVDLDWRRHKDEKGEIIFLNCDEQYECKVPPYVKETYDRVILTHFKSLDIRLAKRFERYIN